MKGSQSLHYSMKYVYKMWSLHSVPTGVLQFSFFHFLINDLSSSDVISCLGVRVPL